MSQFGKVDWVCIGIMIVVILLASGYLALYHGWLFMWVVIALVVVSFIVLIITARRRMNRADI